MILNTINQNLQEVCIKAYDEFIEHNKINGLKYVVFDILRNNGYLKVSKEETLYYYNKAQQKLIERKPEQSYHYGGKRNVTVSFYAKNMILLKFFKQLKKEDNHIKNLFK